MAFLTTTTNALCIPLMGAVAPRRSLIIARAATKPAENQERATIADTTYASGQRRAMMLFAGASAITASTAISQSARAAGGWSEIKDVTDPYVQDIGKWAVTEYNKGSGNKLQFVKVVSGQEQVVAGMNYVLKIEAKGGPSLMYKAALFDPLPGGERELKSFVSV